MSTNQPPARSKGAARLDYVLTRNKISLRKAAADLGYPQSYGNLVGIKRGTRKPSLWLAIRIEAMFGIPVSDWGKEASS